MPPPIPRLLAMLLETDVTMDQTPIRTCSVTAGGSGYLGRNVN